MHGARGRKALGLNRRSQGFYWNRIKNGQRNKKELFNR